MSRHWGPLQLIVDPDLDTAFQNAEWVDVSIDLQEPSDFQKASSNPNQLKEIVAKLQQDVISLQDPEHFKVVQRSNSTLNLHSRITHRGLENLLKLPGVIKKISLIIEKLYSRGIIHEVSHTS